MYMNIKSFILIALITFMSFPLQASDKAKEKRWADQIVDALIDGEAVWLNDGKDKFLGIYTENYADKALGTELPNHGWATLSLQMPILENEADHNAYEPLFVEVPPRLDAGIAFLEKKGFKNIVVIGHSFGCTMISYSLAKYPRPQIKAMAVVGMSGSLFDDPEKNYFVTLPKLKMPILDIFGSEDLEAVLKTEKKKAQVAKESGNTAYTQIKVPGANHFFIGKNAELIKEVSQWLAKNAVKKESKAAP
jgi:pimeloyl-ACP methyl ester carboxylesterase